MNEDEFRSNLATHDERGAILRREYGCSVKKVMGAKADLRKAQENEKQCQCECNKVAAKMKVHKQARGQIVDKFVKSIINKNQQK